MTHELKVWPEFFAPLLSGEKTFEARKDDRGFHAGDTLRLREWSHRDGYSGREIVAAVSYLLAGSAFGIVQGYVVMAIRRIDVVAFVPNQEQTREALP